MPYRLLARHSSQLFLLSFIGSNDLLPHKKVKPGAGSVVESAGSDCLLSLFRALLDILHYTMKGTTLVPTCSIVDHQCLPLVLFHFFWLLMCSLFSPMYFPFSCYSPVQSCLCILVRNVIIQMCPPFYLMINILPN